MAILLLDKELAFLVTSKGFKAECPRLTARESASSVLRPIAASEFWCTGGSATKTNFFEDLFDATGSFH